MKEFFATKYKENAIELSTSAVLSELYETLIAEENFILKWKEGKITKAEVIIAANLVAKIKTGDIKLTAEE